MRNLKLSQASANCRARQPQTQAFLSVEPVFPVTVLDWVRSTLGFQTLKEWFHFGEFYLGHIFFSWENTKANVSSSWIFPDPPNSLPRTWPYKLSDWIVLCHEKGKANRGQMGLKTSILKITLSWLSLGNGTPQIFTSSIKAAVLFWFSGSGKELLE